MDAATHAPEQVGIEQGLAFSFSSLPPHIRAGAMANMERYVAKQLELEREQTREPIYVPQALFERVYALAQQYGRDTLDDTVPKGSNGDEKRCGGLCIILTDDHEVGMLNPWVAPDGTELAPQLHKKQDYFLDSPEYAAGIAVDPKGDQVALEDLLKLMARRPSRYDCTIVVNLQGEVVSTRAYINGSYACSTNDEVNARLTAAQDFTRRNHHAVAVINSAGKGETYGIQHGVIKRAYDVETDAPIELTFERPEDAFFEFVT